MFYFRPAVKMCHLILLIPAMLSATAGTLLVDLAKIDTGRLSLACGAKVERLKDGPGLRLIAPPSDSTPGFELSVPQGAQDVSAFMQLSVEVKNTGSGEATVSCRADNPDARGLDNCILGSLSLSPGQSGDLRVNIRRKKPEWIKVNLFGMRGYPWSGPLGIERSTQHLADPALIVKLALFTNKPREEQIIEVRSISAVGSFPQPTRLLADSAKFFPFIDQFGQYIHADWPGKVHSLAELTGAVGVEEQDLAAHPGPGDWDKYGGWKAGPQLKATGFFYAAKYEGRWWLVDPEGRLFFSHGVDCVYSAGDYTPLDDRQGWFKDLPSRDSEYRDCYSQNEIALHGYYHGRRTLNFDFGRANLMRKYGPVWLERFTGVTHRRLRSWGLNTIACWSSPEIFLQKKTPYTGTVDFNSKLLEGSQGYWGKFRDVFDPEFRDSVRAAISRQTADSAHDPWCLGYFVDNEISWGNTDAALGLGTIVSPAGQAAKEVFLADLKDKYGTIDKLNAAWGTVHASWEALRQGTETPDTAKARADLVEFTGKTARTYFKIIREAMKEYCPDQLYLGCRFAWANPVAVKAAAEFCDVLSYNIYQLDISRFRLPVEADVPIIIGEFHMGALDRGMFHTGLVAVASQEERAEAYKNYLRTVLRNPQFVGCAWFQFRDESNTGRPYDEENYQIGFLDVADTPYAETIQAARGIGYGIYKYRVRTKQDK